MGRPQTIPGHPLRGRTLRTTDRAWAYLTQLAEKKGMPPGALLDQMLGGSRHGGWNDR